MPHEPSHPSPARAPRQKSTLFCPACGHESPIDGDWEIQTGDEVIVYGCPACDEVVTERPASGSSSSSHDPSVTSVAGSIRLAFVWTVWPCTPAESVLPDLANLGPSSPTPTTTTSTLESAPVA